MEGWGSPSRYLNKRTFRGSLWLPSQETPEVCHADLSDPKFFLLLLRIDEELSRQSLTGGCEHCGAVLHRGNYPRKPRGCPQVVRAHFESRFSACCSNCRRRTTPPSVRFLHRRSFLACWVALSAARVPGQHSAQAALCQSLGVSRHTLARWRRWWSEDFVRSSLWQAQCARFMPPVDVSALPGTLLARFIGPPATALHRMLLFLSPLSVRTRSV
jgi:hypothetical protein